MRLMSILLASTMKADLNGFLEDYGIPVVAACLILAVAFGIVKNLDLIIDEGGTGTKRQGVINVVWIVGFVVVGLAVLAGVIALITSKLTMKI